MPDPSTALVRTLPAEEAIVARFLARARALTPREWGELDAIGRRELAGGPIAAWRHARRQSAMFGPAPLLRDLMTVANLAGRASFALERLVLGRTRQMRRLVEQASPTRTWSPEVERMSRASSELYEIGRAQPGGPGCATALLYGVLTALWLRAAYTPAALAEIYAPVEPIIPFASIDGT